MIMYVERERAMNVRLCTFYAANDECTIMDVERAPARRWPADILTDDNHYHHTDARSHHHIVMPSW